ncbi:MAG: hypothetical protein IJY12_05755 [Clostridia bacterium]|nr:hypothetical protein [Clostridia bacterium]
MTLKELTSLKHLNRECMLEKKRLASLRGALERRGSSALFGVTPVVSEAEKQAIRQEILALEETTVRHLDEIMKKYEEITVFIHGVCDPLGRMILSLRYINGLSWSQVAAHIGGSVTEEGIRKYHDRHLAEFGITE